MTSSYIVRVDAVRTIVDLPDEQIEALRQLSESAEVSRAELVRRAVAEYVQRHWPARSDVAFGIWREAPRDGLDHQRALRDEWGC